ncbi:MAG: hypothetical protein AB1560_08160 [Pseudomonadota bacterium]
MSLKQLASRLSRLKAKTPEEAGLILFPLGAIYSAVEAERCGFADRSANPNRWKTELNNALLAANEIAKGHRPKGSSWVCIVHFNNALFRIDVGFERLVRYVTRKNSQKIKVLIKAAKAKGLPAGPLRSWERVRGQEVNKLKHRNPSSLTRQRMTYAEMTKALADLIDLVERVL